MSKVQTISFRTETCVDDPISDDDNRYAVLCVYVYVLA